MIDTKTKILDAAQRLIAEHGYSGTSLRHIIAEAGVNLASVHYHFGSKEELLNALVWRKVNPVNEKRLEMLDRAVAAAAPGHPPLDAVLEAFLCPMAEPAKADPQFVKVMGRILAEGLLPQIVEKNFSSVAERFFGEIRRALPGLSDEEFEWRRHFLIGAMAHTMCGHPAATTDFETRIAYLIRFLVAGLNAPALRSVEVNA